MKVQSRFNASLSLMTGLLFALLFVAAPNVYAQTDPPIVAVGGPVPSDSVLRPVPSDLMAANPDAVDPDDADAARLDDVQAIDEGLRSVERAIVDATTTDADERTTLDERFDGIDNELGMRDTGTEADARIRSAIINALNNERTESTAPDGTPTGTTPTLGSRIDDEKDRIDEAAGGGPTGTGISLNQRLSNIDGTAAGRLGVLERAINTERGRINGIETTDQTDDRISRVIRSGDETTAEAERISTVIRSGDETTAEAERISTVIRSGDETTAEAERISTVIRSGDETTAEEVRVRRILDGSQERNAEEMRVRMILDGSQERNAEAGRITGIIDSTIETDKERARVEAILVPDRNSISEINGEIETARGGLGNLNARFGRAETRLDDILGPSGSDADQGRLGTAEGRLDDIDGTGGAIETLGMSINTERGRIDRAAQGGPDGVGGNLDGRLDAIDRLDGGRLALAEGRLNAAAQGGPDGVGGNLDDRLDAIDRLDGGRLALAEGRLNAAAQGGPDGDGLTLDERLDAIDGQGRGRLDVAEGRLGTAEGRIGANEAGLRDVNDRVDTLEKDLSTGIAMALALQSPSVSPGKTLSLSFGVGNYNGENAVAFSGGVRVSENLSFNGGVGFGASSRQQLGVRGGFSLEF